MLTNNIAINTLAPRVHEFPISSNKFNILSTKNISSTKDISQLRKKKQIFLCMTFTLPHLSSKDALTLKKAARKKHIQKVSFSNSIEDVSCSKYLQHMWRNMHSVSIQASNPSIISQKCFKKSFLRIFNNKITSASLCFSIKHQSKADMEIIKFRAMKLEVLKLYYASASIFDILSRNIHNVKKLKSLEIVTNIYQGSEKEFASLCSILKKLNSLENLHLSISQLSKKDTLSSLSLAYLLDNLKSNQNLKKLSVQILGFDGYKFIVTDVAVKLLCKSLKKTLHPKLEKLELDLSIYEELNAKHLIMISNKLKDLNNLTELSLTLSPLSDLSQESLVEFSSALFGLYNLSKLSLRLPEVKLNQKAMEIVLNNFLVTPKEANISVIKWFSYHKDRTKILFKGLVNLEKYFPSVFESRQLFERMFKRERVALDFSKSQLVPSDTIANITKSLLTFPETIEIFVSLAEKEDMNVCINTREQISFILRVNDIIKINILGNDDEIAVFISGLSVSLLEVPDLYKLEFDLTQMAPLGGETLLSIGSLFEILEHIKDKTVIFSKIEPDANAKFKVTSAIANILQSGGDLVLNDQDQQASEKEASKNSIFNSLKKPNQLDSITEIDLKFRSNDIIPYLTFDVLKKNTAKLSHLQNLSLDFGKCTDFGAPDDFITLQRFINDFKNLSYLNIDLSECHTGQAQQEFQNFISEIKGLRNLQTLVLNFEGSKEINDVTLELIGENLLLLVEIKILSLNLKNCAQINDKGPSGLARGMTALKKLKELDLSFSECNKITDKGFGDIAASVKDNKELALLSLDFKKCPMISNVGILSLTQTLTSVKTLHTLCLNLEECSKITNDELAKLFKTFSFLSSLSHLNLNFAWNKNFSDAGLADLCASLAKVPLLTKLQLNCHWCYKVSDEGVNYISKMLQSTKKLSLLELTFKGCLMVSDKALIELSHAISNHINDTLTHLQLNFSECTKLNNQGIQAIAQSIVSLKQLQSLILDFNKCAQITDQGMNMLLHSIYSLENIVELCLDFNWCSKISSELLNRFRAGLVVLNNLDKLKLVFQNLNISEEQRKAS